jgi:hypothetical protein
MRKHSGGLNGRYAINKIALHLYRIQAFRVTQATPRLLAPDSAGKTRFTFDPSGRASALFQRNHRAEQWKPTNKQRAGEAWHAARAWDLPAPMRCEVLANAEYVITEALLTAWVSGSVITAAQGETLRLIRDSRQKSEAQFRTILAALIDPPLGTAALQRLLADALTGDCGKGVLLRDARNGDGDGSSVAVEEPKAGNWVAVPRELVQAGNLAAGVVEPAEKLLVIDAENGLGYFTGTTPNGIITSYCYGFSGPIGAGTYQRHNLATILAPDERKGGGPLIGPTSGPESALEITDSATYHSIPNMTVQDHLVLQAHDQQRPYLELSNDWTFTATTDGAKLVLDGLWIGGRNPHSIRLLANPNCSWASVTLRHVTLDPGGKDADGVALGALTLSCESTVQSLTIYASIVGPVIVQANGLVESLHVRDTIIDATHNPTLIALAQPRGILAIAASTVLGAINVRELEASEVLSTGKITVDNLQEGCIRFSVYEHTSYVPRAYRCHTITNDAGIFTSKIFGDASYCQLSDNAPQTFTRGGEDGVEIGAFSSLLNTIKLDSLRAKVDEFVPFGLIPIFITET